MPEEKINELVKNFPASGKKLLQHLIDEFAEKGIIFTEFHLFLLYHKLSVSLLPCRLYWCRKRFCLSSPQ